MAGFTRPEQSLPRALRNALEQMQFLESGEYPVGEIDIDAERIKNLALKLERQSFAFQEIVVFRASARSSRLKVGVNCGVN